MRIKEIVASVCCGHLSHAVSFHYAYWHPEGVLYHWLLTDWPAVCGCWCRRFHRQPHCVSAALHQSACFKHDFHLNFISSITTHLYVAIAQNYIMLCCSTQKHAGSTICMADKDAGSALVFHTSYPAFFILRLALANQVELPPGKFMRVHLLDS